MKTTKLLLGSIILLLFSLHVRGSNSPLEQRFQNNGALALRLEDNFSFPKHGHGKKSKQKQHVIKFNVVGVLTGQYQLAYEHGLNDKMSLQLSAGYISLSSSQTWDASSYSSTTSGFIIVPEFRYYFSEMPKKFYVAPFARIRSTTEKLTDTSSPIGKDVSYTNKTLSIGGGVVLGGQFLIADAVAVDIFIGPQYKSRSSKRTYDNAAVTDDDFNSKFVSFKIKDKAGVGVRFGVNIGFAF
jgi:hypothetical protein